jgi:hypothetical protein
VLLYLRNLQDCHVEITDGIITVKVERPDFYMGVCNDSPVSLNFINGCTQNTQKHTHTQTQTHIFAYAAHDGTINFLFVIK